VCFLIGVFALLVLNDIDRMTVILVGFISEGGSS